MLKMSLNTGSVSTEKIAFQKENPGQSIDLREQKEELEPGGAELETNQHLYA